MKCRFRASGVMMTSGVERAQNHRFGATPVAFAIAAGIGGSSSS